MGFLSLGALKELGFFAKKWFLHPLRMGSVVPSSRALARLMAHLTVESLVSEDYVIELGAGTGRFTQALIDAGVCQKRIICLELDPDLAFYLQKKFPDVQVIQGNACFLDTLLPQALHRKVGVVLSGLPMLMLPALVQEKIIQGAFNVLKTKGCFLQFTYSPFSSVSWQRFGLIKKKAGFVMGNFPPATVWRYQSSRCIT